MTVVQRFFEGFNFVRVGWRLKSQVPRMWYLIIVPLFIVFVLLWTGVILGTEQITLLAQKAIFLILGPDGSGYSGFLYYPLVVIFWLVFIVMYFYVVYVLASVISSPFYSVIAERTLIYRGALNDAPFSFLHVLKNSFKMFLVSLARGLFLLALGVVLIVASFVPGLNLMVGFVAFVILAFDSSDYALEAMHLSFSDRIKFLRTHLIEFCGMGAFVGLTAFVPGLILLVMPFAVIGASDLVARRFKAKMSTSEDVKI
jgi:uncharacterized protein involved in cysteine biosynthesis